MRARVFLDAVELVEKSPAAIVLAEEARHQAEPSGARALLPGQIGKHFVGARAKGEFGGVGFARRNARRDHLAIASFNRRRDLRDEAGARRADAAPRAGARAAAAAGSRPA